ncbi:MAG: apolipoprotein N-acyltransferase [Bacteroidales bacterium]|nr:apolipoprotein N-acyltransferase [Bacteroidales bacterium]
MKKWLLALLSGVLLSLPWLVPHTGFVALFALVPLLLSEKLARESSMKGYFFCHYSAFVLWNALTTFWVCNATVGGGIFAILANAFQMSLVFEVFRFSRKRLSGVLPYLLLAFLWLTWEHFYFYVQISWPWLTFGNAFAGSTRMVQWYEFTGTMGGSLWVWACNLLIFGIVSGAVKEMARPAAKLSFLAATLLCLIFPPLLSLHIFHHYEEKCEGTVSVVAGQPNLDPYSKFESMSQSEQDVVLLKVFDEACKGRSKDDTILFLAPETFTSPLIIGSEESSVSVSHFKRWLAEFHPSSRILFGATSYELYATHRRPHPLARGRDGSWHVSHNSAVMLDTAGVREIFHKSKLVVGTELTPYPAVFVPLDEKLGGVMGRCVGQEKITLLHAGEVPVGCAVCYESIYPEYCTGYVREGAGLMAVITNDAWWGNTPGYRQHLNYSRLRAIELRRDIARCANTGISAIIDQRGEILQRSAWWEEASISGTLNLNYAQTVFARYGDFTGRACVFAAVLLLLLLLVRKFSR